MKPFALLSVSDKQGLIDFARGLHAIGFRLLSTGGTAQALRESSIPAIDIAAYTGSPEMFEGRVKTLHPKIHGGILYKREHPLHQSQATIQGIEPIDLVVVNLYPFHKTISRPSCTYQQAIEQIDIGGPALIRSAAKNHATVTVIVDPEDYPAILDELNRYQGTTLPETRLRLAAKAFAHTAAYDSHIANYLLTQSSTTQRFPEKLILSFSKAQELRYGENPHQTAALYGDFFQHFQQLQGKELSYNNLLDLSAAVQLISEFPEQPTLAILKHNNPCGVGSGSTLHEAWELAYATDRQAPFGGVIIVNRELDGSTAQAIAEIFSEIIIAPAFSAEALHILQKKKNLRLVVNKLQKLTHTEFRTIVGDSLLAQEADFGSTESWRTVTQRQPTADERAALQFSWRVVKHVRSNAIVFAQKNRTLGIGAGQMSRVDASKIAVWKASEAGLSLKGSVVASDAFFPFPDGLIAAAEAGATAAIQPGGSVRDSEVIAAADRLGLAMIFTGQRHFKH
ncbi:MAG: bifunctional phosphoribosylaminoimidazolecarboxamide formyltransferase/IMP cyclohydrolase [Verrucomicrobiae bacterium]|nr:bifunctional phosphoribosylaminoimidazolecarboxamide formyltransferase/IMP cyclohydrolase [Verrucomicrobiae bacterium]